MCDPPRRSYCRRLRERQRSFAPPNARNLTPPYVAVTRYELDWYVTFIRRSVAYHLCSKLTSFLIFLHCTVLTGLSFYFGPRAPSDFVLGPFFWLVEFRPEYR